MKFQGINHEFHVQVISLLFYTPENPFKMLNKQTKVQANKGTGFSEFSKNYFPFGKDM